MVLTRSALLVAIAVACFIVAFLIAVAAIAGAWSVWIAAGLAVFAAAHLP